MSGFPECGLERKLAELNSSQVSIQTLSLYLIHHRKHHSAIVKIWYQEFLKAQERRKLAFIYLANDMIQNSRKKGGEFGKSFWGFLKNALEYMARNPDKNTKKIILRILRIWEERGIYETKLIRNLECFYIKAWDDLHGPEIDEFLDGVATHENHKVFSASGGSQSKAKLSPNFYGKKQLSRSLAESGHSHSKQRHKNFSRTKENKIEKATRKTSDDDATNTVEGWEVGAKRFYNLCVSPNKDAPTEQQLISIVKSLDEMPSADAVTRGKIAILPPEVSDLNGFGTICLDSGVSRGLQKKIDAAHDTLKDYVAKLDTELNDRSFASMKLLDLVECQRDFLMQAEQRLEEHQNYGKILSKRLEVLKAHVLSMPDLSNILSVTEGLSPLPSAGDLFKT